MSELDEIAFEKILADKQHAKLMSMLNRLLEVLSKDEDEQLIKVITAGNQEMKPVLNNLLQSIHTLNNQKPKELPIPQVIINTTELSKLFSQVKDEVLSLRKELKDLATKKKEWRFDVVKDSQGRITSVNAKQL